jgi:hypothetical protein
MNNNRYKPSVLLGTGRAWQNAPILCAASPDGSIQDCGFGCGALPTAPPLLPDTTSANYSSLLQDVLASAGSSPASGGQPAPVQFVNKGNCANGCPVPTLLQQDPFISISALDCHQCVLTPE